MRFTVVLFHDKETGVYEAVVPALPNCVTQGATIEEALAMAQDAAELRLATMESIDDGVLGESEAVVVATVDVRVPVPA
ncbi:MAG TPA: type II toxin-antitoxin system HicB family antitoxin [Thermomicrobiales bacterium]|nr:type II toxin-antitoxin system HicB family antitoxin [Thermomicrobiales bacterium]